MKYLVLILALLCPLSAFGAVTWDATNAQTNFDGDTTDSYSLTVGAGSNIYVGVCVHTLRATTPAAVTGITIGGSAATFRVGVTQTLDGKNNRVEYWDRVLGSTSGAQTIAITVDNGDVFTSHSFSLHGVDQTTPVTDTDSTVGGTTSLSLTLTTAAGDMLVSCLTNADATTAGSITEGANQTERWEHDHEASAALNDHGTTQDGADGGVMSVSWTSADYSALIAVNVNEAAASTRRPIPPMVLP